jgi:general stress protein YciG
VRDYELTKLRTMLDDNENTTSSTGTSNRGFASMDEDKQREIASKGGKAAHQKGTAHEFNSQEAAEAGRKGGRARHGIFDDST